MLPLQQTIQFSNYSDLYDLIIPRNNLLRQINDLIDFSFIKKELVDKYCQDNGRMAECPIQMFKYLLLKQSMTYPMSMLWNDQDMICLSNTFLG